MSRDAFADIAHRWGQLVSGLNEIQDLHPELATSSRELESLLREAMELGPRRATLYAEAQELTRQLERVIATGKDIESRLRFALKSRYGLHGTELHRFGMAPRRPWRRRNTSGETPPEP